MFPTNISHSILKYEAKKKHMKKKTQRMVYYD